MRIKAYRERSRGTRVWPFLESIPIYVIEEVDGGEDLRF